MVCCHLIEHVEEAAQLHYAEVEVLGHCVGDLRGAPHVHQVELRDFLAAGDRNIILQTFWGYLMRSELHPECERTLRRPQSPCLSSLPANGLSTHTMPGDLSTSMWVITDNSTFPQYYSHVWWRIGVSRKFSPGNFCTFAKISGEFAKALKMTFFGLKTICIFIIHTKE